MQLRRYAPALLALWLAGCSTAYAGAGGNPQAPGHHKLPAPAGLTCLLGPEVLSINWLPVLGAAAYQVSFEGTLPPDIPLEGTLFVDVPPLGLPVVAGMSLSIQVRALPPPKKPDHPPQGVGPKGDWSEPCLVEVP